MEYKKLIGRKFPGTSLIILNLKASEKYAAFEAILSNNTTKLLSYALAIKMLGEYE